MGIVTGILFGALIGVGSLLFVANVVVVVLRLSHRPTLAIRVASGLSPLASYLRLGGGTHRPGDRSKHAQVTALPLVGELSPYQLGVIGSVAVELGSAFKECSEIGGRCPDRYKQPFYLGVRALLAFASGTIPAVADAPNALTSFYLGASAPLFLDRLARGVKPVDAVAGQPEDDRA